MPLRRVEESSLIAPLFAVREWLVYRTRDAGKRAQFEALASRRRRDRLFIVGNGPSLGALDLDRLIGEDYVLCNMAEHLPWTRDRPHPYYLAADTGVPQKYRDGRPGLRAQTYFYADKLKRWLDPEFARQAPIFWFRPAKGGVLKRGLSTRPWISVAAGQTILVTAAQLGWALGYRALYVIGCDLDYGGPDPYAYRTTEVERARAARDNTRMTRRANEQFAILRRAIEARGGALANAGAGGRLEALPRVAFADLFADARV